MDIIQVVNQMRARTQGDDEQYNIQDIQHNSRPSTAKDNKKNLKT